VSFEEFLSVDRLLPTTEAEDETMAQERLEHASTSAVPEQVDDVADDDEDDVEHVGSRMSANECLVQLEHLRLNTAVHAMREAEVFVENLIEIYSKKAEGDKRQMLLTDFYNVL